jgi:hypothetical protein
MGLAVAAIADLTTEMNKPRIAALVALSGYHAADCRFPETRAPRGRTAAETRRLEKIHVQREFARHVRESEHVFKSK